MGRARKSPQFSLDSSEVIRKQPSLCFIFHDTLWRFNALRDKLRARKMGLWWGRRGTSFEAKKPLNTHPLSQTKDSRVPSASPREGKGAEAEWKMIAQFSKQIPGSSVSPANHRPERAVCLSPFVWSFLGSEPCAVTGLSYSLFVHSSIKQFARDGSGPVVGQSWKPSGRRGSSGPSILFQTLLYLGFLLPSSLWSYVYIYIRFSFVLSWEGWYIHTLIPQGLLSPDTCPTSFTPQLRKTRAGFI